MAQMVFGRWADTLAPKRKVMHFATAYDMETGYTLACGRPRSTFRVRVYSGFKLSPEDRAVGGERMTNCKDCRRAMQWASPTDQRRT